MSILRACDVCKMPHLTTKRYGVNRQRKRGGINTTYGAGGIDLCDPCWTRICQPKMKAHRGRSMQTAVGRNPEVTP